MAESRVRGTRSRSVSPFEPTLAALKLKLGAKGGSDSPGFANKGKMATVGPPAPLEDVSSSYYMSGAGPEAEPSPCEALSFPCRGGFHLECGAVTEADCSAGPASKAGGTGACGSLLCKDEEEAGQAYSEEEKEDGQQMRARAWSLNNLAKDFQDSLQDSFVSLLSRKAVKQRGPIL
jgi:hypothetical protein